MKIGIEAQRIFRERKHGMDFVALELIRNLQIIDTQNQYVIFVNEGPDTACLQETDNFKIVVFGGAYPVWEQIKLPKKAREYELDLLHCTSNTAPVQCPCPLAVTIHDIIYFETHPLRAKGYNAYQKFGNLYRRWVVGKIIKTAARIYTVSHFEKRRFEEFLGLSPDQVEVVYNGVGKHFQKIDDQDYLREIAEKYGLPEKFFLFLGNTDPKKNTRNTVISFARYCSDHGRDYKLVIGDLDPAVIKSFLREEGLEEFFDQIQFTGYIQNQELPAIINLATIFLYPSKRESFGIPILEGMASGTAVITSNRASMPEVAGDAAILVDPEDKASIVEAIDRLVQNPEYRQQLAEKGLEQARKFSWENTARQSLESYQSLLKERG